MNIHIFPLFEGTSSGKWIFWKSNLSILWISGSHREPMDALFWPMRCGGFRLLNPFLLGGIGFDSPCWGCFFLRVCIS